MMLDVNVVMNAWDAPVTVLPDIGPARASGLAQLGVATVQELLLHFPRCYEDRRYIHSIGEVALGQEVTVQGEVLWSRNVRLRGRMSMAVVGVSDGSGELSLTFFGRGFLANTVFRKGVRGIFTGVVESYKGLALKNPEYEVLEEDAQEGLHTGRVVPIYRLTEKISQRMLRRWIQGALTWLEAQQEGTERPHVLLRAETKLKSYEVLLRAVHFPSDLEEAAAARDWFAYEELLGVQLGVLQERALERVGEGGYAHETGGACVRALAAGLPFTLTSAQQRAVTDILQDMASPYPMMRLLQGDVGCGKTVVALHAMAAAVDGGYQTALMAPTEILAEQHAVQMEALLKPLGVEVALLTGAMRAADRVREAIASGTVQVVVGTHTLIQEKTLFHRLGLVVVDEQHRFGVVQRETLQRKGHRPDVLHMSATPIPRTLAITVYGGMDITVIDALPPGRLPVKTRRVPQEKVADLYDYLRCQVEAGFQAYIVCPLIDESERRDDLTPVLQHFDALSTGPLAGVRTGLLHGRLDSREKEEVMTAFKEGEIDILFSTTVIEVGVDVPRATTMVIEDAAQFGLTQLHQLRGRVGRGAAQAYCFLLGEAKTKEGVRRLEVLCTCTTGFDIAEEDLKLRGPGEFYGVRQAGLSDLRVADLIRDARLLDKARREAQHILRADPELIHEQHAPLAHIARRFQRTPP